MTTNWWPLGLKVVRRLDDIAERWRQRYCPHGVWRDDHVGIDAVGACKVYDQLVALGPSPTPEDVNAAIAFEWMPGESDLGSTWGMLECSGCDRRVEVAVQIHEEYGSLLLCKKCVAAAGKMIENERYA